MENRWVVMSKESELEKTRDLLYKILEEIIDGFDDDELFGEAMDFLGLDADHFA